MNDTRKNKNQYMAYFGNWGPDFLNYLYWNVQDKFYSKQDTTANQSLVWQKTFLKYFKVPLRCETLKIQARQASGMRYHTIKNSSHQLFAVTTEQLLHL